MAENAEGEQNIPVVFADSGDEDSLNGFQSRGSDNDSDSDVDRDGLEEDNGGPTPGFDMADKEEAQWTDHLSNF